MLINCIGTRQYFFSHGNKLTTEKFNLAKWKWGITGKVTCRRCRYFWTSMCVNLRANYIQLKVYILTEWTGTTYIMLNVKLCKKIHEILFHLRKM